MSTFHIGITIGPIYKTFQKADKTREVWGSSYLFSYLCRELVKKLNEEKYIILLPNPAAVNLTKPGVGLYPDRILLQVEGDKLKEVTNIVKEVKNNVVDEMMLNIKLYPAYDPYAKLLKSQIRENYESSREYIYNYIQVYTIQADLNQISLQDKDGLMGTVKSLNTLLDHTELRVSLTGADPDPVKVFLRGINHSFLLKDALHNKFNHFPSLPEITTTEIRFLSEETMKEYDRIVRVDYEELVEDEKIKTLSLLNSETSSDEFFENTSELLSDLKEDELLNKLLALADKKNRRLYHRYIAIIHADGDRMGKLIGQLDDKEVNRFSEDLLEFAKKANKKIAGTRFTDGAIKDWGYGGAPIYIGGDDLVFFAPVASRRTLEGQSEPEFQTVFHLIRDIDKTFEKIFNEKNADGSYKKYPKLNKNEERPCLTYGVSIAYLKRPLKETYFESLELMKAVKNDDYKTRNRISFRVTKHSGQWFGGVIDKNDSDTWNKIVDLFSVKGILRDDSNDIEQFVNSVTQKLRFYQAAILKLATDDSDEDLKEHIMALFDHAFDEGIHDTVRDYLDQVRDLIIQMLRKSRTNAIKLEGMTKIEHIEQAIDTLHGILRFLHFIRDARTSVSKQTLQIQES